MGGIAHLYKSSNRGKETAGGYERRLGSRMTLLATTTLGSSSLGNAALHPVAVTLGATHAQTSWRGDKAHTCAATADIRAQLDQMAHPHVLLGGDTWGGTCHWVGGLVPLVGQRSGHNTVVRGRVVVSTTHNKRAAFMDDYICASGFRYAPLSLM